MKRDQWTGKIGFILAVAGSAVGLGNFLRFPVQMASNGGSAFMIPYLIAIFVIGFPMILIEMFMGRYVGTKGHGTTPYMFHTFWKNPISKYLGVLGVVLPTIVVIYYLYIESWSLAYAYFSITGAYQNVPSNEMGLFLSSFQGVIKSKYFSGIGVAYTFFIITFLINLYVMYKGISGGIEKLAKIGMPLLFLMGIALMIRVLTLGAPNPQHPEWNVLAGLKYIWAFDFSKLNDSRIWIAAAGQVFFTLSVGWGLIQTYASYLKKDEDLIVSSIMTTSTNEFAEVILGSTIAIPLAVMFFGPFVTTKIAESGSFNLAFHVLPNIFKTMSGGLIWGFFWFFLLFIAGITSSVSLLQPAITFLEDEFGFSRKKAVLLVGSFVFLAVQPVIFFIKYGYMDELDFWAGTIAVVFFAFLEIMVVNFKFGIKNVWEELHKGANIKLSKIFYYIMGFITPLYLFGLLAFWIYDKAIGILQMEHVSPENYPFVIGARLFMIGVVVILLVLVRLAYKKNKWSVES